MSKRILKRASDPLALATLERTLKALHMQAQTEVFDLRGLVQDLRDGKAYAPVALLKVAAAANRHYPDYWDLLADLIEVAGPKVDFSKPIPLSKGEELFFGSFEHFYHELLEPWVGPIDKLKDRLQRFRAGALTREQGATEIRADLQTHGTNQHTRGDYNIISSASAGPTGSRSGTRATYLRARLERDAASQPDSDKRKLARDALTKLERGKISVRGAAIEAGIITPPTLLKLAQKAFERLEPDDRAEFRAWLKGQK